MSWGLWGTGLPGGQFDCPSCNTLSDIDEVAALGGRCPVCGKYDTETDVGKHYGAADEGSRGWHHTASTDGIRYAAAVEADVAEDLQKLGARPRKITPPWSDYYRGEPYPLQGTATGDLIHLHRCLTDAERAGEPPREGCLPHAERIPHLVAELLDRHEAGDPEATRWADRGSYIKPDYMNDAEWQTSRRMYPEDYPVDPRPARRRKPTAAVNQDLVDRLHGEFKDWHRQQPKGSIFGGGIIGGLNEWPNIEKFLKDRYPAAHRGLDMGLEQAGALLDDQPLLVGGEMPGPREYPEPYETGPEAEATHGYDPKEIAAGMLLLHNKTDRFRGDMSQEDQARLNDIAQKRFQMQRDYEQRTKTAMPRQDAYDAGTLKNNFGGKPDQTPPFPGPWFHGSPDKLEVGDILHPGANKNYEYEGDRAPRQNWVFMDLDARQARMWAGEAARQRQMPHDSPTYVYHVEPLDEGPWPWNEYPDMGYASPRARVVERRHVDEMGDWDQQPQFGPRRKRDISRLMERLRAHQAAVNQDLVDRLHDEFHDWWRGNGGQDPADLIEELRPRGLTSEQEAHLRRGPLGHWPNIERFLKDNYPAAHRDHPMGYEYAREMLDRDKNDPLNGVPAGPEGYETGLDAEATHGYDPREIASAMLLLHNKTDRFRGDMSQEDQDRLTDIFIKRQKMQRDYEQRQTTAHRIAMPAPLPQGVTFKYHPELVWSPGVTAHLPDGRQVGSLEWYDDDHVMVDLGTRRPGEIDRIQVPEDQRGQSIATSMFDFAKQHEPRLHHSDILTEDGRGWSEYEQSRDKSPMPKRFAMPTVYHGTDPESAQSILQNGFSPGGWGDKSFFSTEPQDAASYGESLLSVDIPDDEWERTERHPWMHHETAEIDPHRLQELGIKPRLLDEVPHRPLTGPPVWPKVYRKNPDQTWQEGRPVDQVARQIDTDDDLTQMRGVPDWPKGTFDAGTGTYWDVDFGDGPIPVHQRDLYT